MRSAAELLAAFAVVAGAATLLRWSYYGAILPNSVTAKSLPMRDLGVLATNLAAGAKYIAVFGRESFVVAVGALLSFCFSRGRASWLLAAVVAAELPSVLLNGGDWMPHHRLLVVYVPILTALLALTLDGLRNSTLHLSTPARLGVWAALALCVISPLSRHAWRWPAQASVGLPGIIACYGNVGARLSHALLPGDTVSSEALGLVGYQLPDVNMHDALGLTDAWVARHGVYHAQIGRVDYAYTYNKIHPGIFLIHQEDLQMADFERASRGRFAQEYRAYYVDPPAPCRSYAENIRLAIAVRSDLLERVHHAFRGLTIAPFPALGSEVDVHAGITPRRTDGQIDVRATPARSAVQPGARPESVWTSDVQDDFIR